MYRLHPLFISFYSGDTLFFFYFSFYLSYFLCKFIVWLCVILRLKWLCLWLWLLHLDNMLNHIIRDMRQSLYLVGNGLTTPLQDGSEADDNTESDCEEDESEQGESEQDESEEKPSLLEIY